VGARRAETADEEQMKLGLEALYEKRDPVGAAVIFRGLLARSPEHYGATYQLAMALDRAGKTAESRPLWEKVAGMATGYHDDATLADARRRMAEIDQAAAHVPDEAEQGMNVGIEALYTKHDAFGAAAAFRRVLAKNPDHLGATYQLAKALDAAGKPVEARALWQRVAVLAAKYDDARSAEDAKKRLSGGPPPAAAP
jgi:cytochrome c-type biogenesis protein CcmH/NrfG